MAKNEQTWRIRVQIYKTVNIKGVFRPADLMADTHPDHLEHDPLDASEEHRGIQAVLDAVSAMVHAFHNAPPDTIEGARSRDMARRIPTIRVYISTGNGRAVVRFPYTPDGETAWCAVMTIQRDDWQGGTIEEEPPRPSVRIAQ